MSVAELQSWLLETGIRDDLATLTRLTVRTEIDHLAPDPNPEASTIDWPRLLLAGSILARSELRMDQEAALRIATGALSLDNDQRIKDAGAVLMGKLSNFRAVALAGERELIADDLEGRLGIALYLASLNLYPGAAGMLLEPVEIKVILEHLCEKSVELGLRP